MRRNQQDRKRRNLLEQTRFHGFGCTARETAEFAFISTHTILISIFWVYEMKERRKKKKEITDKRKKMVRTNAIYVYVSFNKTVCVSFICTQR
jgi:hypothetical protein